MYLIEPPVVNEETFGVCDSAASPDVRAVITRLLGNRERQAAGRIDSAPKNIDDSVAGFLALNSSPNPRKAAVLAKTRR